MNTFNTIVRTISYSKDALSELNKNRAVASRYFKDAQYLSVMQNS